jgi:hypothetical protein
MSNRRAVVGITLLAWAIVTPFMWRDLEARAREQVRGPKWVWWIASTNLSGSAAYWMFGRKSCD